MTRTTTKEIQMVSIMPGSRTVLVLVFAFGAFLPGVARADSSCDTLFWQLRAAGGARVLWTTNYHAPSRNHRFMGTTDLTLVAEITGDMQGSSRRRVLTPQPHGAPVVSDEHISLRLRSDGLLMFNERYGPFDPVCTGDRFVRVDSGDSIEVFGMVIDQHHH
jgi:hypothetical protein